MGITKRYSIARNNYYEPKTIFNQVKNHLQKLDEADWPDYLTFVANGEPTLDINLAESISLLKQLNIPIAIITNGTLLKNPNIRNDLALADWVSVKVDAGDKATWENINWPMPYLDFESHVQGLLSFSSSFKGKLVTETMLVEGVNDSKNNLAQTAELICQINPSIAYISIPTRPPAISSVKAPAEQVINNAYQIFTQKGLNTEFLIGFEGTNTGFTGNAIEDIVNICTVHPIREDTMCKLLTRDKAETGIVDGLIYNKLIKKVQFNDDFFYIRQFHV